MPSLADPIADIAKIIYLGDSGGGKTGSKAALVAAGHKLRMIDTDNGFKILKGLLTSDKYPYKAYMKKAGIVPDISYIPIEIPMELQSIAVSGGSGNTRRSQPWNVLSPASSKAWNQVINQLRSWKDGETDFGSVEDWGPDTVLDIDSLSTLAELAKFFSQDMNNHLGALDDDHGRDSGAAQELIRRLLIWLSGPKIHCNVIVTTHITWVDQTGGATQSPEQRLRDGKSLDARGFPQAIGRSLSPVLGKRWNDMLIARRTGSDANIERKIYTIPTNNTDAKNSVWLEPTYPLSTGLAEIFAALQFKDPPLDLIEAIRGRNSSTEPGHSPGQVGQRPGPSSGFGSKATTG